MYLKLREIPQSQRPRERMQEKGPEALSNAELLALILTTGTPQMNVLELSTRILSRYDFESLSTITPNEMQDISGLGAAKSCQIVACIELAKRFSRHRAMKKERITCAREVYELLAPSLGHEKKEHLAAVFLDVRHHIIKHETIFVGSLDTTVIHPREIFKQAIRYSSSAVIIAHNHPSGDPSPSPEDISVTKQLVNAGKIVGINLIDHIIITANDYVSLREQREDII